MAKKRRQARIPTPAWERPRGTIGSRVLGRGFQFYGALAIGALLFVAVAIIIFAFGSDELEKRRRPGSTAVQIEDTRFRLDYFASRLEMYVGQFGGLGADVAQPLIAIPATVDLLVEEEIVRRFAGEFDVAATEEEIEEGIASRLGITVDDEAFDVVFEQELSRSGLSEEEYRLMVEATVLTTKLREHFQGEVPDSAESVRYRQIVVSEQERADELVAEIENGEDFAALAAEDFNLDVENKDEGGEVGWVPRGVLDASTEELIFSLEVAEVTTIPLPQGVLVVEVEEKADDREIEEDQKPQLADGAFNDWVGEKRQAVEIQNFVLSDGGKCDWAVQRAYGVGISCGI